MTRSLISPVCIGAVYDYVGDLPGATEKIRRYARAAGIIRQSEPEWIVTQPYDIDNSARRRRKLLSEHLRSLDYESPDDVQRFVTFCGFLLGELQEGSVSFQSISTPLAQDGWIWVSGQFVRRDTVAAEALAQRTPQERVREHLWRIERDLIDDPPGAVSSARNLIESVCRGILRDHGKSYEKTAGIGSLLKKCYESLGLSNEANDYEKSLAMLLGGLNGVAQGTTSLRNAEGTAHASLEERRLNRICAQLGVNAAITLCTFLVDYDQDQLITGPGAATPGAESAGSRGQCPGCQGEIQDANYCETCSLPIVYLTAQRR